MTRCEGACPVCDLLRQALGPYAVRLAGAVPLHDSDAEKRFAALLVARESKADPRRFSGDPMTGFGPL